MHYEHSDEPSGSIQCAEFPDWLNEWMNEWMTTYWILKDLNSRNEWGDRKGVTYTTSVLKLTPLKRLKMQNNQKKPQVELLKTWCSARSANSWIAMYCYKWNSHEIGYLHPKQKEVLLSHNLFYCFTLLMLTYLYEIKQTNVLVTLY